MREQNLAIAATISALLHLISIGIFLIVLIVSNNRKFALPNPYTVRLVSSFSDQYTGLSSQSGVTKSTATTPKTTVTEKKPTSYTGKTIDAAKDEINRIKAIKNIEKLQRLRQTINISSASAAMNKEAYGTDKGTSAGKPGGSSYYDLITKRIWEQWICPPGRTGLETIITISIKKDGNIAYQRLEKSSGDSIFDRSATRAINKASPLPPPPEEMEIGVRFYP